MYIKLYIYICVCVYARAYTCMYMCVVHTCIETTYNKRKSERRSVHLFYLNLMKSVNEIFTEFVVISVLQGQKDKDFMKYC